MIRFGLVAALASGASMTGWISDASCGKSNANGSAESRECAKNCLKNGADAVFVSDADGKVYKLTLENGGLKMVFNPGFALPDDVKAAADAAIAGIEDGSIVPARP